MASARATAARILAALIRDQGSLTSHLESTREHAGFQLIQEYCYGCCRWFYLLQHFINALLSKPLKQKDSDLLGLLLLGIYQLREMRTPDHAAINETVAAADELGKPWARGLVNAVLRNYLRQREALETAAASSRLALISSHPDWLVSTLHHNWPQSAGSILENNNRRAPMTLRVNLARTSRKNAGSILKSAGMGFREGTVAASAIVLDRPHPVASLPGFTAGLVSIQDEGSQLAAPLLDLRPGHRVLDACSAPGGKLCHMLESEHSLSDVIALDMNADRLHRVEDNLQRLGLRADCRIANAAETNSWWDGRQFERILLDAPCSATGVIRRHPDIKLLRSPQSITELVQRQQRLLEALWPCLAADGLLLYATCSILPQENSEQMARFAGRHADAKIESMPGEWGVECAVGRQLLPVKQNGPDGFFYCLLRKQSSPATTDA